MGLGILGLLVAAYFYPSLPEQIGIHFNAQGQTDGYGSKIHLLILPSIAMAVIVALNLIVHIPHHFNYLTKITEDNAEIEYRFARKVLLYMAVGIGILFLEITWETVRASTGGSGKLSPLFWVVFIAEMVLLPFLVFGKRPTKTA